METICFQQYSAVSLSIFWKRGMMMLITGHDNLWWICLMWRRPSISGWWRLRRRNERGTTCTCWQQKTRTLSSIPQRQTVPSASLPCCQKRASCSGSVYTLSAGLRAGNNFVALSYVVEVIKVFCLLSKCLQWPHKCHYPQIVQMLVFNVNVHVFLLCLCVCPCSGSV